MRAAVVTLQALSLLAWCANSQSTGSSPEAPGRPEMCTQDCMGAQGVRDRQTTNLGGLLLTTCICENGMTTRYMSSPKGWVSINDAQYTGIIGRTAAITVLMARPACEDLDVLAYIDADMSACSSLTSDSECTPGCAKYLSTLGKECLAQMPGLLDNHHLLDAYVAKGVNEATAVKEIYDTCMSEAARASSEAAVSSGVEARPWQVATLASALLGMAALLML